MDAKSNGESWSEGLALVRRILRCAHHEFIDPRAMSEISGTQLLEFLDQQKLRYWFGHEISGSDIPDSFDAKEMDLLNQFMESQRNHQRGLLMALGGLIEQLEERTIPYRVLKGPFLATRFFGDLQGRFYRDLDVLVPVKHLPQVHDMLEAQGFERLSKLLLGTRVSIRAAHGWDYARGNVRLDLHWTLGSHPSYDLDLDRLWQEQDTCSIDGHPVRVLSDESALLYLTLSCFEDIDRGAGRLRHLLDVDRMLITLDSKIQWPAWFQRAHSEGLGVIAPSLLAWVSRVRGAECFPHLDAALSDWPVHQPPHESKWERFLDCPPGRFRNKLWGARLYSCNPAVSFAWWAASLPVRIANYEPSSFTRLWSRGVGR